MSRAFVVGMGFGVAIQPLTCAGAWLAWQYRMRRLARS